MNMEKAKELQTRLAWEAIALHALGGDAVKTEHYDACVQLIGKAWDIPVPDTAHCLDLIAQERAVVKGVTQPDAVVALQHIMPEEELPINATGQETLNNVWGLFKTATKLADAGEREAVFGLANELAELHVLDRWIQMANGEQRHTGQQPAEQTMS